MSGFSSGLEVERRVRSGGPAWRRIDQGVWEATEGEGYVEVSRGRWFAYPNINGDARLACRGPYSTRSLAMQATAKAYRAYTGPRP